MCIITGSQDYELQVALLYVASISMRLDGLARAFLVGFLTLAVVLIIYCLVNVSQKLHTDFVVQANCLTLLAILNDILNQLYHMHEITVVRFHIRVF
jgi:hypothetical protein